MEALGNKVIVAPKDVETISEGGIIMGGANFERNERAECSEGTVVDIGPSAYLDPIMGGEPWVKVGDKVIYAKYSGKFIKNPEDDKEYVVINDDAIQVKL